MKEKRSSTYYNELILVLNHGNHILDSWIAQMHVHKHHNWYLHCFFDLIQESVLCDGNHSPKYMFTNITLKYYFHHNELIPVLNQRSNVPSEWTDQILVKMQTSILCSSTVKLQLLFPIIHFNPSNYVQFAHILTIN